MEYLYDRMIRLAEYIADRGATVRDAAMRFGISKSTVHKDMTVRLREVSPALYSAVREVLDRNKAERHMRGGEATRRKYELLRKGGGQSDVE